MSSGHGLKGGSVSRFVLTVLMLAGIVACNLVVCALKPTQADSSTASLPSVETLPATDVSGTGATLNGEVTALGGADFSAVSAGGGHSVALRPDGTLWAWGLNADGQLGLGDTTNRDVPTKVGDFTDWVDVSAGYYHSLGVRSDGTLWAWGLNADGQLGLGDTTNRDVPTRVGDFTDWVDVSAGYYHSLGVRLDHTLWAWGRNRAADQYPGKGGQLGVGDITDRHLPTKVGDFADWIAVSGGISHSLGVRSDHTLWAWGWNPHGELGLGDIADIGQDGRKNPTPVDSATNWVSVCAELYCSLGLRSNGSLWAWGENGEGELGIPPSPAVGVPTEVGSGTDWLAVDGEVRHFLGVRSGGTLWAWGKTAYVAKSPTQVENATDWVAVAAGGAHSLAGATYSLALRFDGSLWAWGSNTYGQLGLGDTSNRPSPTRVILSQPSCQVSFEWGESTTGYDYETAPRTMTSPGTFSADVSGLTLGATYRFRAKAVGDDGEAVYGVEEAFITGLSPVVEGVDPGRGKRGQHLTVSISGANLDGATNVSFGAGIMVGDLAVSDTDIIAEIAIDGDAEVGARDVSVTTRMGGTAVMTGGFAVAAGSSRLPLWVYPVAAVGGLVVLMILVAVGARLMRRLVG